MTTIASISELLKLSGSQYRIYDIGRKIDKISKEQFNKIEFNQLPYPFPSQGHAHLAIAFWQKESQQPYLWFVKLPLDERGLLNQGARNHFIAIIIEALGSDLAVDPTEQQEELLKSNPYHFTPAQYKLATLNSLVSLSFNQSVSRYYQAAKNYLTGKVSTDEWHHIGVQGLSDFAAKLAEDNHSQLLAQSIVQLPTQVLFPLCSALENHPLPVELIDQLIQLYKSSQDTDYQQHILRSLASSSEHPHVQSFIKELFTKTLADELVIVIAGRNWLALQEQSTMMSYLELIVQKQDAALFNAIFKDIVAIPALRLVVFSCMRSENRSPELAKAIGSLFNTAH